MPNRRRRKLSKTMSAVAALAVASPCAYFLVYESTADVKPVEHHEFKRAASVADLPNELISALSQGLSQFGVNLPPVPALGGTGGASTGLGTTGLGTTPGLASPGLGTTGLGTTPGLASPGLTPTTPGALPGLTPPTAATGTGVNPALTSPTGVAPGLTSPSALSPATATGEVPISAPVGLDPGADGTYPILGDTSGLGGGGTGLSPVSPAGGSSGGGGLVSDLMQAANQLGASQAIDLLKGLIMPAIMQQVQGGAAGAPAAAGAAPALPGAAGLAPVLPTAGVPGVPAVPALPAAGAPAAAVPAIPAAAVAGAPPV
ncbi:MULTISPECIES: hypothetical protein [Mycobacterium]|nr:MULTISPECIES: hypothetical protein [Mycobacterium]MDP7731446.1 hypothetical protein [Mycobacterium sp. TY813]